MHLLGSPGPVDVADPVAAGGLDDLDGPTARGAQPDAVGRPARAVPHGDRLVPATAVADEQLVGEDQAAHAVVEGRAPPPLVGVGERQLVGGAAQVRVDDVGVLRVHHRRLGRATHELLGVGGEPLVELVVAGHQHGGGRAARPTGPPDLLPERGDRAGEAVEHHGVEPADVDAQLERGGGHDRRQLPGEELVLDRPALLGEVAAAVGAHPPGQAAGQAATHVGGDRLGRPAAAGEGEGRVAGVDQAGRHRRRLAVRGRTRAPVARSSSGGCQIAIVRAGRGAPRRRRAPARPAPR